MLAVPFYTDSTTVIELNVLNVIFVKAIVFNCIYSGIQSVHAYSMSVEPHIMALFTPFLIINKTKEHKVLAHTLPVNII